jgi:hypothetical protein
MDFARIEVRDMETGRDLWLLEPSMGRMYAHLEYSNGFLIFDRSTGHREVWRLSESQQIIHPVPCNTIPSEFDPGARPDAFMLQDSERALQKALRWYGEPSEPDFRPRGCFEPYAVLRSPEETRAYRFVYPTMMTAAHEKVYVWDVPSARIVEVVSGIQKARLSTPADRLSHENLPQVENGSPVSGGFFGNGALYDDENITEANDGDEEWLDIDNEEDDADDPQFFPVDEYLLRSINYIDHSLTHIFLAGHDVLKVFNRASVTEDATKSSRLALAILSTKLRYGRWKYTIKPGSRSPRPGSALVPYKFEVSTMDSPPAGKLYDQFKAGIYPYLNTILRSP